MHRRLNTDSLFKNRGELLPSEMNAEKACSTIGQFLNMAKSFRHNSRIDSLYNSLFINILHTLSC